MGMAGERVENISKHDNSLNLVSQLAPQSQSEKLNVLI